MTNSEPAASTVVDDSQVKHPVTEEYFRNFNQNQFERAAALFSEEGSLVPPFEKPIVGRAAIATYLEKEAGNITAFPKRWETQLGEDGLLYVTVTGKVNAVVFKVNVAWYFTIRQSADNEPETPAVIERARIKLIASPAELLGLRSSANEAGQSK